MRVVDQTKETVKLMSVQEIQRAFIPIEQSEELQRAKDVARGGGGGGSCQRLRLGDSIIGSASAAADVNMQMQKANNKCVQHVHNS